jgi:hypothetical protein
MTARRFPPPWSAPQKRSPATTTDWSRPVQIAQSRLPAPFGLLNLHTNCPGCIRVGDLIPLRKKEEGAMKALALLTAAAVTLFSVAASAQTYGAPYGKGKAPPPPPVVTKG